MPSLKGLTLNIPFDDEKVKSAGNRDAPNLLIDDNEKNVAQFKAKGGIAILHTSAENSIKELQQLGF